MNVEVTSLFSKESQKNKTVQFSLLTKQTLKITLKAKRNINYHKYSRRNRKRHK
jgi:hypothetical protein